MSARGEVCSPKGLDNLDNKMEWSTVSKAADRSSKSRITVLLLSIAVRISLWTLTRAVSVLWNAL